MRPASLRLLLAASLLLGACRAFPVGMYVPDATLDALEDTAHDEDADLGALEDELRARYGPGVEPAPPALARRGWYRLDRQPVRGPFAAGEIVRAAPELAPGDLVLVKNPRAQSLASALCFEDPPAFDHLGVLAEREGRLVVCDSWPHFSFLGCAEDFAARFQGGVRATPLARFAQHYETLLFVRFPDAPRRAALARAALDSLDEGIEFDPHHDPADPRLSCTEYVNELCDRVGLARPSVPRAVVTSGNAPAAMAALGFPTGGYLVPDGFLELAGCTPVAWISRHPGVAGARALEVAVARLAARYRRDGRVGDLLGVDRLHFLRYRRNVARFLAWAEALAEHEGWSERAVLERELAALEPRFFVPRASVEHDARGRVGGDQGLGQE